MSWKTYLLIGSLALAASSLCAKNRSCVPGDSYSGFFLGGGGGVARNGTENTYFSLVLDTNLFLERNESSNNVYQICPWGEVYGGWGWQFCWLYLGGRFGVNFSQFDPDCTFKSTFINANSVDVQVNKFKTELNCIEYTLDFKPGVVFFDRTLVFGLVGGAYNRQHLHGKTEFTRIGTLTESFTLSAQKWCTALRTGIGIEHLLTSCISLNLTYVYTTYWKLRARETRDDPLDPLDFFESAFKSSAHKEVTSIGLIFYF